VNATASAQTRLAPAGQGGQRALARSLHRSSVSTSVTVRANFVRLERGQVQAIKLKVDSSYFDAVTKVEYSRIEAREEIRREGLTVPTKAAGPRDNEKLWAMGEAQAFHVRTEIPRRIWRGKRGSLRMANCSSAIGIRRARCRKRSAPRRIAPAERPVSEPTRSRAGASAPPAAGVFAACRSRLWVRFPASATRLRPSASPNVDDSTRLTCRMLAILRWDVT
jgi:hypothetical protein